MSEKNEANVLRNHFKNYFQSNKRNTNFIQAAKKKEEKVTKRTERAFSWCLCLKSHKSFIKKGNWIDRLNYKSFKFTVFFIIISSKRRKCGRKKERESYFNGNTSHNKFISFVHKWNLKYYWRILKDSTFLIRTHLIYFQTFPKL